MVEVVGLDVGDHGDVGVVGEERAVALIGLDDEGRPSTEGGVGAELRDLAPELVPLYEALAESTRELAAERAR